MNESCEDMQTNMRSDVAAVLLAGGRSRRMGFDKASFCLNGTPMAQLLAMRLMEITNEVLLSANDPSAYSSLNLIVVPDIFPGCGPLAGLHAAMIHSQRPWVLALACDLPRISSTMLKNLVLHTRGFDAVVPVTTGGRLHPVCAAYSRACLPLIERNLRTGIYGMIRLLEEPGLHVRRLTASEGGYAEEELRDIDEPRDIADFLRLHKS